jgi:YHS domain-containing protein
MTRSLFIFLGTFLAGATIALISRTARHDPHADPVGHPAGGGAYAPMVSNPLTPAKAGPADGASATTTPAPADPHANHGPRPDAATASTPVNTACAICGMPVDPSLPTATYQGKTIGFGCKTCRPLFEAEPDRYGPSYLKNEVLNR